MTRTVKFLAGLIGTALVLIYVGGLSQSISSGFAGFSGGLPYMIIVIIVGACAVWDFIDECVRRK